MEFSPRSPSFETMVRSTFPELASMSQSEVNEANFVETVCAFLRLGLADQSGASKFEECPKTEFTATNRQVASARAYLT